MLRLSGRRRKFAYPKYLESLPLDSDYRCDKETLHFADPDTSFNIIGKKPELRSYIKVILTYVAQITGTTRGSLTLWEKLSRASARLTLQVFLRLSSTLAFLLPSDTLTLAVACTGVMKREQSSLRRRLHLQVQKSLGIRNDWEPCSLFSFCRRLHLQWTKLQLLFN